MSLAGFDHVVPLCGGEVPHQEKIRQSIQLITSTSPCVVGKCHSQESAKMCGELSYYRTINT
jgi:hypothetical protein